MGIPIIGNHRQPTEEKILAGCGLFAEDSIGIRELQTSSEKKRQISERCIEYYQEHYSQAIFQNKLLKNLNRVQNSG
jgi:hypothetical protein